MNLPRAILAAMSLIAISCVSSMAEDKPSADTQRACVSEDLVGHVFKMVDFRETPPRSEARWVQQLPFHYLSFPGGNAYYAVATNMEIKSTARLGMFLKIPPGNSEYYTLSKDGVLNLMFNDKLKYSYRCIAVLKPFREYIKGDLILTAYTRKAESQLYKLYRRWY